MNHPRGIHYVYDSALTWIRQKQNSGFRYLNQNGTSLSTEHVRRIQALVVPPAWTDVRISPDENAHIQAVGIDGKGRKQYIYHPDWIAYNQKNKFESLHRFSEILPILRETVQGHMRQHTLTRERVLATVIWLLEHTFIRVGNKTYAKENNSYGLTTLRMKHVTVEGNKVRFSFKGKSHVYHELDVHHPRIAATIRKCSELPGYELFQYLDENEERHTIDSVDVNQYLKEVTGEELSAKDFRTWGGTTLAGDTFYNLGEPTGEMSTEKAIVSTVKTVASHLGNTTSVCRKYYIHPSVISSYEKNKLIPHFNSVYHSRRKIPDGLLPEEYAVSSLLWN